MPHLFLGFPPDNHLSMKFSGDIFFTLAA